MKKRTRPLKLSGTAAAIAAARTLDPADLKKLMEEKQPPSPEEQKKNIISELLEKAKQLPDEELSKLVQSRVDELRALEILNIQRNMVGCQFDKPELDGFLQVFSQLPAERRTELGTKIQQAAVQAGLQNQTALDHLSKKLCRMGLI